ncbi:MAG TPA: efflux RND transporter periplasmic adaptor subunit [Flavobacteriales bacterium]|nr:efflux RND transporter periplasmic adaptor subunit [Flavobacteriales bacterium]
MTKKDRPAGTGVEWKREGLARAPWAAGAVALLLVAAGCGGKDKGGPQGGMGPAGPMAVQIHVLSPAPLSNSFTASGTLLANESVEIQSEVNGRVTAIGFNEGERVAAGQVLVRINDDDLQAQLRKAQADLQLAQVTEERQAQLLQAKGISQEAFDATQAQRIGKQAEVDNLRALIAKYTIRAPFSGTIGLRNMSAGGFVSPNTPIATLTQSDPIKLDFSMPERFARQLRPGSKVSFTLEGDTTQHVAEVYAEEASVDLATRSIKVRARCANPAGRLVPGSFAKVNVLLETITDALTIPAEALVPDIQGEKVMVMKGGKAQSVRVHTGIRTETTVQLISNVQPGDTVITSALLAVRDGMPVRPAMAKKGTNGTEQGNTMASDEEN